MKTYKLTIEIKVSENWIQDGFNPESKEWKETIEEAIESQLPYAYSHEFLSVRVTNVVNPKYTLFFDRGVYRN